ncbi:hypothetical protein A4X09_0g4140 [Tilletia walkeri]|uniref:Uncharacterized protein n=1 Tax=Tilletia walkeri TaxID=117179 RepID=A0A8X7T4V3_9BASI|nr:hypothetical protein A4X09_0g4140 [Tilletia walkeri]
MPDSKANVQVYVNEIEVKATRREEAVLQPTPAATTYLAAATDKEDRDIDDTIAQHNRNYPRYGSWEEHLINLSDHLEPYLSQERRPTYQFQRCSTSNLVGVKLFDHLRSAIAEIHSLPEFRKNFDNFSGSVLNNLNWTNVGIAGGSALACLTITDFGKTLKNSDIDLFIWGLDATRMHKRMRHIRDTIMTNTPGFAAAYMIERSAGAITFVPRREDTGRKIQIVLCGYENPAAVLGPGGLRSGTSLCLLRRRPSVAQHSGGTIILHGIHKHSRRDQFEYATRGYGVLVRPDVLPADSVASLKAMNATLREKEQWACEEFVKLPWTGTKNYNKVFNGLKSDTPVMWTHSLTALATLAALWNLAYTTGRIGELLEEVGAASHIYGLYEGSDMAMGYLDADEWLSALEIIAPSLKSRSADVEADGQHVEGARPCTHSETSLACSADTSEIEDATGDKFEICIWSIAGEDMWQPQDGVEAFVHQLLITSAMLTAWTMWTVASGAPWRTMYYGRSLHNAHIFSYPVALSRVGDLDEWVRE